jgi:hypothetical protein
MRLFMACRGLPPVFIRCLMAASVLWLSACTNSETSKRAIGAECLGDDDLCASGQCFVVDSATSICSKGCSADTDCPDGFLCDAVKGEEKVCLPRGLGGRCLEDTDCAAGFRCDTESSRCYIPVTRTLCAPCTSSKQCPAGGVCRGADGEQFCSTPCGDGDTCPSGFVCEAVPGATAKQCLRNNEARSCVVGKGLCGGCRTNAECGGEQDFCVRNLASNETFCGTNCTSDKDCPTNFTCMDLSGQGFGPNQCVPNSNTCKRYCDTDEPAMVRIQCGFGATCNVASRECVQATDGTLCAACESDDDCASRVAGSRCLENTCPNCPYRGERFCSAECTPGSGGGQGSCQDGFTCAAVGDATGLNFCLPNAGSCKAGAGKLGDDCSGGGADNCRTGLCLAMGLTSMCSARCTTTDECGDPGFRCCARTGTAGNQFDCDAAIGEAGGVCAPVGGTIGADCSVGQAPCFEGVCLDLGTARVCAPECPAGATCPSGFSCRKGLLPKGDGTSEEIPVCFPDGGGDVGADCTFGPAACRSGYCLKKGSGNICTALCSVDAPCPEDFSCKEIELSTDSTKTAEVCVPKSQR